MRSLVAHVAPSWPGGGSVGIREGVWGGVVVVVGGVGLHLDFRVPDSDFRKHRRAMAGVDEPGGVQCNAFLEPQ